MHLPQMGKEMSERSIGGLSRSLSSAFEDDTDLVSLPLCMSMAEKNPLVTDSSLLKINCTYSYSFSVRGRTRTHS